MKYFSSGKDFLSIGSSNKILLRNFIKGSFLLMNQLINRWKDWLID